MKLSKARNRDRIRDRKRHGPITDESGRRIARIKKERFEKMHVVPQGQGD